MTARRARRAEVHERLDRLVADPPPDELPADQEWIDMSNPGPPDDPPVGPWWRRPGRLVERWLPGGSPPAGRRLRIAVIAGVLVGVAVAVLVVLSSSAGRELPPDLPVAASTPASPAPTASGGGSIVVSVVGRVARPGLVTLPDGARVADAVQAAGGPQSGVDLGGLNIARRLADGEQIYVGVPAPQAGPSSAVPDRLDLNTASVAQLDTLPGVGSVTAQRVVDWRTRHGRFTKVDQLREIDGIGPARFAQLRDLVVVR